MEVKRATCVAPATCVALPGGVKDNSKIKVYCGFTLIFFHIAFSKINTIKSIIQLYF